MNLILSVLKVFLLFSFMAGVALGTPGKTDAQQMSQIIEQSSYSLLYNFWNLSLQGNGKGWIEVIGDVQSPTFTVVIRADKAGGLPAKCKNSAPHLTLHFTKVAENRTLVTLDIQSVFFGKSLQELFAANNALPKIDGETYGKNVLEFEVLAGKQMNLFGLDLKLNTDPKDDADFGSISFLFTDRSLDLKVFDGDDDGGNVFSIIGANEILYDRIMPVLQVDCY